MAHHVLDHDHRAVHHQPEVEGSQAQQAGGDAEAEHAAEGEQQRQRDGQCHDGCRPQVAQEQKQHGDDQQAGFQQIGAHRVDDVRDQLGAVVDRDHLDGRLAPHVLRKGGLDLLQLVLHGPGDLVAVLANEHKAQAEDTFALAVGRHRPAANLVADGHVGHVPDLDRHAVLGGHHNIPHLLGVDDTPLPLDEEGLAVLADGAAADVLVVLLDGLHHLVEGQAVFDEPVGVEAHLVRLSPSASSAG